MPAETRSTSRKRSSNSSDDELPSPKRSRTSEADEEGTPETAEAQTSEHVNANLDDTHHDEDDDPGIDQNSFQSSDEAQAVPAQQEFEFDRPSEWDESLIPPEATYSMSEGYPSEIDQEVSDVAEEPAEFYQVSDTLHKIKT